MPSDSEIRALIAPMPGGGVLLPGSMIAEVVNYNDPEPFHEGPEWLLGEVRWNGWQLPVANLGMLAGLSDDYSVPPRARVLVVKTLSTVASVLHVGLLTEGLPRLKNVTPDNLEETEGATPEGIFSHVVVEDQAAVIPDLDALALTIEKAVYTR